jgi:hypothetical protein
VERVGEGIVDRTRSPWPTNSPGYQLAEHDKDEDRERGEDGNIGDEEGKDAGDCIGDRVNHHEVNTTHGAVYSQVLRKDESVEEKRRPAVGTPRGRGASKTREWRGQETTPQQPRELDRRRW